MALGLLNSVCMFKIKVCWFLLFSLLLFNRSFAEAPNIRYPLFGCHIAKSFLKAGIDYRELENRRKEVEQWAEKVSNRTASSGHTDVNNFFPGAIQNDSLRDFINFIFVWIHPSTTSIDMNTPILSINIDALRNHPVKNQRDLNFIAYMNMKTKQDFVFERGDHFPLLEEIRRTPRTSLETDFSKVLKHVQDNAHQIAANVFMLNVIENNIVFIPETLLVLGPLTTWLLQQKKESVEIVKLYDMSVEIYKDPWMALTAIYLVFFQDVVLSENRNLDAVLASKIKKEFGELTDPYGALYHFFGYILHAMLGYRSLNSRTLSLGHEVLVPLFLGRQIDWEDFHLDQKSIAVGIAFNRGMKNFNICRRLQYRHR